MKLEYKSLLVSARVRVYYVALQFRIEVNETAALDSRLEHENPHKYQEISADFQTARGIT